MKVRQYRDKRVLGVPNDDVIIYAHTNCML